MADLVKSRPASVALLALALASVLAASQEAMAAAPGSDPAAAEALFQEGRRLMGEGKMAQACPKFAESHRLDPATGTLLNLAVCHETEGKLATAWAEFNDAMVRARVDGRSDREKLARERITGLEPRLIKLTIVVDRPRQPADLEIQLDGLAIGPAVWGMAIPVDPGAHDVRALAPGRTPWTTRIRVAEPGQKLTVEVPLLQEIALSSAAGAEPTAAASPLTAQVPLSPAPSGQRWSTRKRLGVGLVVTGAASLAVGSVFGLHAFSRWSDRGENCPMNMCTAKAVRAGNDARTAATVSNVAFGVGLAAAAIGTYLSLGSSVEHLPAAVTVTPVIDVANPGLGFACAF